MRYRYIYKYKTGLTKVKTRLAIAFSILGLGAGGIVGSLVIFGAAHAAGGYTLFGDAVAVSGGNPGTAIQTDSVDFSSNGGIDYTVPSGMTFNQLTNLGTDYKITVGDCGGGSPRFQININGKNVFVYIGPSPSFTGCTVGSWISTGNLTTSPGVVFDTSQLGGSQTGSYTDAETLLGDQTVTGIQLVTDGGWAVTGGEQTVLFDNTQINNTTYDYEALPSLDTCKNGGWQQFSNPSFKNQGQCVSYAQHTNGVGADDTHAKAVR